jgi:hypothetical protein
MTPNTVVVLEAPRLPELYRKICLHSGISLAPGAVGTDRFVLRSGSAPAQLFAELLEEAFAEDAAEVPVCPPTDQVHTSGPGHVTVCPGFESPCPVVEGLRRAVSAEGESVLLFAIERRDEPGRLLEVTWAVLPEEEPEPQEEFRAALWRENVSAGTG